MGLGAGYWAIFVTIAAEQFGTNLRATVATTVPNFVRGAVVPLTISFQFLKEHVGLITGTLVLGVFTAAVAFLALRYLDESFHQDLDFVE
jgi:hypothetical protein